MWQLLSTCIEDLKAFHDKHKIVCGGILAVCAGIFMNTWVQRSKRKKRRDYPRDTVILHDFGRGPYAPSIIMFTVKLETYLRIANIPYQCDHGMEKSGKQKWPWITYNGEEIADSAFIIQFLNKRYDLDLSAWLSTEQRAVAVAFQRMVEDNLYWALVATRYVNEVDADFLTKSLNFPLAGLFTKFFLLPPIRKKVWHQGMGRHSQEEVKQMARKDLTALSIYLGRKKFLMGDQPCEEDCAVFGQLSQLYWHVPSSLSSMFKEECPQLVAYCERMKDTFWPDWLQCTTQGGTVAATR